MKSDKLPVEALDQRENERRKKREAELKMMKATKKNKCSNNGKGLSHGLGSNQTDYVRSSFQEGNTSTQSLEDIMQESQRFNPREMGEVVEKYGAGEDVLSQMPMAGFPERLATKLLPYQCQALAWLLEKEKPQLPPLKSKEVVQLWKRSSLDPEVFTNIATNFSLKGQLPTLASGGILAASMIICIAVIDIEC